MKEKCLITEWFDLDVGDDILKEIAENPGSPVIIKDRLLQLADTENHNGRIYPREILKREVEKYSKLVEVRGALGELDHSDLPVIELKSVSHLITKIGMYGNEVRGDIEILNNTLGKELRTLVEQKVKIGISSRGVGSLRQESGVAIVDSDFELISFDAVSNPSTPGAYLVEGISFSSKDRYNNLRNILHGILKDKYFEIGDKNE